MSVLSCNTQVVNSRNQIFSQVNSPLANFADNVRIDYSVVGPGGPWILANTTNVSCTPVANPTTTGGIAHPGSGRFVSSLPEDTDVWIRWTIVDGPDAPEELVCGPAHTFAKPTFICVPNGIGSNEVSILEGSAGPGKANLGPAVCPADSYVLHYGTVAGGPYPLSVSGPFVGYSPERLITGLQPKTTYYFQFEARDENNLAYFFGPECSITTLALSCGENVGADWNTFEYGYTDVGYGHRFTQSYPPGVNDWTPLGP